MRHRNLIREYEYGKLVKRYPRSYLQAYARQRLTGLKNAAQEVIDGRLDASFTEYVKARIDEAEELVEFVNYLRRIKCLPKKQRPK